MIVAFLSDIHGNLPALERALASAERHGADQIFVAGDIVGGGPFPREVVQRLREQDITAIRGNVDRKVLRYARAKKAPKLKNSTRKNHAWTMEQLQGVDREWLAALSAERVLDWGGVRVRLVHGSPVSDTDYVYPSITARGLLAKLGTDAPDVLVCGHSHIPFTRRVAGIRVVNCGSVGRSADGDPRGSYALVDVADRPRLRAGIIRFQYNVGRVVQAIREREVPGIDGKEYRRGVKK